MRSVVASITMAVCMSAPLHAASVTLTPGAELKHEIVGGTDTRVVQALPYQASSGITGASGSSTGTYSLNTSHFGVLLNQTGSADGFYGRASGAFDFTVTSGTGYHISDSYEAQGEVGWTAYVELFDLSSGSSLFRNVSFNTTAPLPGVAPGGAQDSAGASVGILEPGREYRLRYVLYSMLTGSGGAPEVPIGSEILRPRPGWGSGGIYGSIEMMFERESVVVPLPPALLGGAALLGVAGVMRGLSAQRRRRASV